MAHYIDSRVWDDEKFLALDDASRNLWLLLLTGPQRGKIPGLFRGTVIGLHETLERSFADVEHSMKVLEGEEMVIVNRRQKVICIPKAPKYAIPPNVNQLKGWFFEWSQEIPNCDQKMRHVPRLMAAVNLNNPRMRQAWVNTFDRVLRKEVDMDSSYAQFLIPATEPKGNVFSISERRAKTQNQKRKAPRSAPRGDKQLIVPAAGRDDIPDTW